MFLRIQFVVEFVSFHFVCLFLVCLVTNVKKKRKGREKKVFFVGECNGGTVRFHNASGL